MRPREMLLDIDYAGLHSEAGSREWILTRRSILVACLSDIKNNRTTGQAVYEEIKQKGGWQHLQDLKGKPFRSFAQFCKSPNGLGLERDEIERRLTAQELAGPEGVEKLRDERGGRPPKGYNLDNVKVSHKGGNHAAYLVARLKRDHPEIAARLADGEYGSARAAARAAGINVDPKPLTELRRTWKRASEEERRTFRAEIANG